MSKPVRPIQIATLDGKVATVNAVFDSGSVLTFLREDKVPQGANVFQRASPWVFRTAARGGSLSASGGLLLVLRIGDREVEDSVWVSPELSQEMLVGAGTMQKWDISIVNEGGRTEVVVGRDLHDPQTFEIDGTAGRDAAPGAGRLQRSGA